MEKKASKKAVKKAVAKTTTTKKAVKKAAAPNVTVKKTTRAKIPTSARAQEKIQPTPPKAAPEKASLPVRETPPPAMPSPAPQPEHFEMPTFWQDRYGDDRMVLMVRDPYWCFVYWDLSAGKQEEIIRTQQTGGKLILRVYDVTDIEFDGSNAHRHQDIDITAEADNWYINVWEADRSYCVELGLLHPDGRFIRLLRSNVVTTPRDSFSPIIDEEWMVVDETFDRLYQTAGAGDIGRSSEAIAKYMLKRVRADVTSGGLASMGSEGGRPRPSKAEDFWLVVNTELIVYGATEPDAKVTIQGQGITLNPDGTFSVRYALPDGKQTIPVKAVNAAGTQERTITPVVEKRTE